MSGVSPAETRPPGPRRILVLRAGAIGDFILTVPALTVLRAHWPQAALTLATLPRAGRLALACGLVDHVRSLDDAVFAPLFVANGRLSEPLRALLAQQELAVNFLHDPAGVVTQHLQHAGIVRVHAIAPPLAGAPLTADRVVHAADQLAAPLAALGVPVALPARPCLGLSAAQRTAGGVLLPRAARATVTLHPGSGSSTKNWPLVNFLALADALADDKKFSPLFVLGEAEEAQRAALQRAGSRHAVLPACDLPELAGALAGVQVHVGNDSGITHLAAAVGTPVVAVFGPTNSAQWAPRGPAVCVLQSAEGLRGITVAEVLRAVVCVSDGGPAVC